MTRVHRGPLLGRPRSLGRSWPLALAALQHLGLTGPGTGHVAWRALDPLKDLAPFLPDGFEGHWLELDDGPTSPTASAVWLRRAVACEVEWISHGADGGLRLTCPIGPSVFTAPETVWDQDGGTAQRPWIWSLSPEAVSHDTPPFSPHTGEAEAAPPKLLLHLQQRCIEEAGMPGELVPGRRGTWALVLAPLEISPTLLSIATEALSGRPRGRWRWMGPLDVLESLWSAREAGTALRAGISTRQQPGALEDLIHEGLLDHQRFQRGMHDWTLWWPRLHPSAEIDGQLSAQALIHRGQRRSHDDVLECTTPEDDPRRLHGALSPLPALQKHLEDEGGWRHHWPVAESESGRRYAALVQAMMHALHDHTSPDVLPAHLTPVVPSAVGRWWAGVAGHADTPEAWLGIDARRLIPQALPGFEVDRQASVEARRLGFVKSVEGACIRLELVRGPARDGFSLRFAVTPWPIPMQALEVAKGVCAPGIVVTLEQLCPEGPKLYWLTPKRERLQSALADAADLVSTRALPALEEAARVAARWRRALDEDETRDDCD
ncbi:MAG: hypothetical protein ACE366_15810 [Bradymonadia bacterium]